MPERYNFITENIDDHAKAAELLVDLKEFCDQVRLHEFDRIGGGKGYFIAGQSIEEDSNAAPLDLRLCLEGMAVAAVFINDPTEIGAINCKL